MENKLDQYDYEKMMKARKIISEVNDYNYNEHTPLTKKLETVLRKIDKIIDTECEKRVQK